MMVSPLGMRVRWRPSQRPRVASSGSSPSRTLRTTWLRVILRSLALSAEIVLLTQEQAVSAGCTTIGLVLLVTSRAETLHGDLRIRFLDVTGSNAAYSGTASGVMRSPTSLLLVWSGRVFTS